MTTRRQVALCFAGTGQGLLDDDQPNINLIKTILAETPDMTPHYRRGVGVRSNTNPLFKWPKKINSKVRMATGYDLSEKAIDAYETVCQEYLKDPNAEFYFFGFSRGAMTSLVTAGMMQSFGILAPENLLHSCDVYEAFISSTHALQNDDPNNNSKIKDLQYKLGHIPSPRIRFMGNFDPVNSVLVPRITRLFNGLGPDQRWAYTDTNPLVQTIRTALAMDERRVKYQPELWNARTCQDSKTVWFPGDHCDVGGGHPTGQCDASKIPLAWMIEEARRNGLRVNPERYAKKVTKPLEDALEAARWRGLHRVMPLHPSPTGAWKILEILPRPLAANDERRQCGTAFERITGQYIPNGEARIIPEEALVHVSADWRMHQGGYRPSNLPADYKLVA
jgi:uncharacterized protein (DUF2235 family)